MLGAGLGVLVSVEVADWSVDVSVDVYPAVPIIIEATIARGRMSAHPRLTWNHVLDCFSCRPAISRALSSSPNG